MLVAEDSRTVPELCVQHPGPIHLLLTNVMMPGMSGSELASLVVARRPDIQVLFMSGYTDNEVLQQSSNGKKMHFLQKPFTPSNLANKVREILDHPAR